MEKDARVEDVVQHLEERPDAPRQDWTPEEEKAMVRKVDWHLFPMLSIVFGLSLLDRSNISAAYIAGLGADLRLDIGTRYSVALLVFFIGYFLFELPSNTVIRRLGARYWLSFLITAWGTCVLGMGFVRSWQVLAVLRALLGVFEAGLFPGALYIISSWYRQYEMGRRVSYFYMASILTGAFGPILAYAFSLISVGDGIYSQGWRWIFICEGIITVVAGMVAPFLLIEFPEKVRFLTDRQKHIALSRVKLDADTEDTGSPGFVESLKMLAFDWKLWILSFQYMVCNSSAYSISFFGPIILQEGMGFDYTKAQLLSTPPPVFTIIASFLTARLSDKLKIRWPIMTCQYLSAIMGLLILLYSTKPAVMYFALFPATFGIFSNIPVILAYAQNQNPRPAKKGVIAAAQVSMGAIGGVIGSLIFRSQDKPRYMPGMWTTIGIQISSMILTIGMSMYLRKQNKLADEGKRAALEGVEGFRYAP